MSMGNPAVIMSASSKQIPGDTTQTRNYCTTTLATAWVGKTCYGANAAVNCGQETHLSLKRCRRARASNIPQLNCSSHAAIPQTKTLLVRKGRQLQLSATTGGSTHPIGAFDTTSGIHAARRTHIEIELSAFCWQVLAGSLQGQSQQLRPLLQAIPVNGDI